jgi:methyl-accepting chemotaxis protein
VQEKEHAAIKQDSRECEAIFERLHQANLPSETRTRLAEVRQTWEELRRVRDGEVIPAIYDGRAQDATALASGPHLERYRKLSDGLDALVSDSRARAQHFKEDGEARYTIARLLLVIMAGLAIVVGVMLTLWYSRIIATPLAGLVQVIDRVAAGDLRVTVETASNDEVGQVGRAMRVMVERFKGVLGQIHHAATQLSSASQHLSGAAQQMSAGAQEQASSLEETAASLEEITASVRQSADMAKEASQVATQSHAAAENGGKVVTHAVVAMTDIHQSSRRITDIIATIDEIAFQTNLLALNAAVEAARAGEQGRGFAVVATEVRNLAQRAASAAKEIKTLIQDSVKKVEDGSSLVNRSGQALEGIVTSVRRVTDLMAEIASTSQEQSTGIHQVNRAVAQMDAVVQQSAGQTEELSSTAATMAEQARALQQLVAKFRLDDAKALPRRPTMPAPVGARRVVTAPPKPGAQPEPAVISVTRVNSTDGFKEF